MSKWGPSGMKRSRSDAAPETGDDQPPDRPLLVGWKEYVELPDWHLRRLKAKIDTGARTSALDVAGYELVEVSGVGVVARLRIALDRRHPERLTEVQAPVLRMVVVRNTSGVGEQRPLIETRLRLGPVCKPIRLTVANRAGMLFRMILGREALAKDFVVDVSKKYLLRR
jgi:hypothetical protein